MKNFERIILLAALLCSQVAPGQTARSNTFVENVLIEAVGQIDTNAAAAKAKLEYLDEKYPKNDAVNYYLGLINYAQGNYAASEKNLKTAISIDSTNVWYWDALAGLYNAQRRGAEAADIYLKLLDEHPEKYSNSYTLTLLGDDQLRSMKDSLALESYDKALILTPNYAPALLGKAEVYRLRNNVPAFFAAINGFASDEAILPGPKCDYVRQLLQHIDGNFYRVWGAQLDTLVNTCVNAHPADTATLRLAGEWYYGTGREQEGRKYFDRMLETNPDNLDAHYIRMQLLMQENKYDEAIEECEKIVSIGGEDNSKVLPALATIGDTWYARGNSKKAFKAYERVLKIDPEYAPVLNNYAYYLSLQGKQLKKAEKMSKITVEKEPDNPTYLDTYAWILHLQGKDQEAKPYFKHAMIYGGKDSDVILEHYSEVLAALGESELAQYYKGLAEAKKQ